jgi:homoserine O-acetyltransferase/O-succinyltransferase
VSNDEYYSQELHGPYQLFDLDDFALEEGGKIRSCKLAYATFGQLSPQKYNAFRDGGNRLRIRQTDW